MLTDTHKHTEALVRVLLPTVNWIAHTHANTQTHTETHKHTYAHAHGYKHHKRILTEALLLVLLQQ